MSKSFIELIYEFLHIKISSHIHEKDDYSWAYLKIVIAFFSTAINFL